MSVGSVITTFKILTFSPFFSRPVLFV